MTGIGGEAFRGLCGSLVQWKLSGPMGWPSQGFLVMEDEELS